MKSNFNQSPNLNNSTFNSTSNTTQKPDRIQQNNLKKIQQHVSTFYSTPQCNGFCQCHICKEKYSVLDKGKDFLRQTSSLIKIDTFRIKNFFRLMSAVSSKVAFRLEIPTLCFFQKGECKLMFKSRNQYIISQQNHQVSKKNVANFFVQANRKKSDGRAHINKNKDNHIRHFNAVVPSYIHGTNEQTKQMKEAKNFFFHIDSRLENEKFYMVENNMSDQVAIVKYLEDKGFELLNEKQLRQLLKSPVNTACIDFIQSYIKPHEVQSQFFFSQYNGFNPIQNNLMWNRSATQVKIQINLINAYSKDYIPIQTLEAYEEVLKEIPQQYILYQNYKMVHYLQLVRSMKVKNLTTVWVKDEFREICFFSIVNFQYDQNTVSDVEFHENYAIKQMIDKPFNDLENELWGMWEKMKHKKLKELAEKSQKDHISVASRKS